MKAGVPLCLHQLSKCSWHTACVQCFLLNYFNNYVNCHLRVFYFENFIGEMVYLYLEQLKYPVICAFSKFGILKLSNCTQTGIQISCDFAESHIVLVAW